MCETVTSPGANNFSDIHLCNPARLSRGHMSSTNMYINHVPEDVMVQNSSSTKSIFNLPVELWVSGKAVRAEALVDSGAYSIFVNKKFVREHRLNLYKLETPYNVYNADGSINKDGQILYYLRAYLKVRDHGSTHRCLVTNLGDKDMILGMTYLRMHNPEIDWKSGQWKFTRCPESCTINGSRKKFIHKVSQEETEELLDDEGCDERPVPPQSEEGGGDENKFIN